MRKKLGISNSPCYLVLTFNRIVHIRHQVPPQWPSGLSFELRRPADASSQTAEASQHYLTTPTSSVSPVSSKPRRNENLLTNACKVHLRRPGLPAQIPHPLPPPHRSPETRPRNRYHDGDPPHARLREREPSLFGYCANGHRDPCPPRPGYNIPSPRHGFLGRLQPRLRRLHVSIPATAAASQTGTELRGRWRRRRRWGGRRE